MKRKSLLFLLLMAVFAPWAAQAQTTVEIGDPESTTTNYTLPVNMYYHYSMTQQIYTAEEIGMAGTITSIAFDYTYSGSFSMEGVQMYMMNVDKESFESNTDMVALDDATLVWEGTFTADAAEWLTIELDTPFAYDGSSSLLVCCYDPTRLYPGNSYKFRTTATEANLGIAFYSDSYVPDLDDLTSWSGSKAIYSYRNNIQLEITPAGGQICEKPEALTANGEPTDTEFSFTIVGGSGLYNIFTKAGDGDWTNWEYEWEETTVDLTNLEGNTAYQVRVQSVCTDMTNPETGDAATSGWKTLSFTTQNPCATPTNLAVSDITTSSATLSWTAGYQETEWTVKYKKSADAWDDANVETVNGTPALVLSNLDGLTTYNVQVYNCENYVSANFTTAAGIPLTEAFGSATPTGWAQYSGLLSDVMNGTALVSGSGWNFGQNAGVFDEHARTNIYGTSCKKWLVMPTLVMEDNVQLLFELAYTKYVYSGTGGNPDQNGDDDKFVVLIQTESGWEILRQWDNAGSEYVLNDLNPTPITVAIDLSSYAGQNIAIAFYGESTVNNADNNLHIDNVSIDYIPDCAKPTGVAASDVTAHEATITWTSDAAAWQVQLDDEDPIDVTEATYTFTGLAPETSYTAKVRANCDGTYSEWTTAVSFTTTIACPAPTTLTVTPNVLSATFTWESFAGEWEVAYATDADADPAEFLVGTVNEATYTVNDLELGDYYFWVRANCGDEDGDSQWAGPASVHIGYCVPAPTSVDNNGISNVTFGMGDYIVNNDTPKATYADYTSQIGAVQAGVETTIAITFKTGYTYNTYVWVDLDNSLSFDADEVVCYGESTNTNPTTLTLNFTIPADQTLGDFRLRIGSADSGLGSDPTAANPCYSSSYGCFQDYTLRVLEAPSCLIPTNITIDYTGGTEATISWTSDAEAWNMRVNGVDVNGVITNPYTLTGLELATTYSVEVQANCGEDSTSEWSNPVSFTTDLCMPEYMCAISYSFTDQYDDSWNGAYINIVDATTEELLYELTMPSVEGPYEGSFNVCDGREIQFVWVSGSYPRECGYTFTHNGVIILEKATNSAAPNAGVFFTYNVVCTAPTYYWDDDATWGEDGEPVAFADVTTPANTDVVIRANTTVYAGNVTIGEGGSLTMEPGAQFYHSNSVELTVQMNVDGYEANDKDGDGGYLLIASPINPSVYVPSTHLVDNYDDYDLYMFDQSGDGEGNQWLNYKQGEFDSLYIKKGYLYANKEDVFVVFAGQTLATNEGVTVNLDYDADAPYNLSGCNLVGNPFTCPATVNRDYCTMNSDGDEIILATSGEPIRPMEGIFVTAEGEGETVTFETAESTNKSANLTLNLINGNNVIDRAIVRFDESHALPKFQLNPNHTKVFIPQEGKNYAVVSANEMGEMPVSFMAESNDTYTLSFSSEEVEFNYLHLIDNLTGDDVDLLQTPSYTFNAKTTDNANRFKLVFDLGTTGVDENFAYYNNGNFIISNEGKATLQVIDVTGRIISSESINGSANVNVNAAAGIYMIRLTNGDNVRVQKIVVR